MPNEQLKNELQRLHADLEAIDANEGPTPQEITDLLSRVKYSVEDSENETQQQNLLTYLNESLEKFETKHPNLMSRITVIMQRLTESGI